MGRVSQAQAQENRRQVVASAARLFRERGVQGVSVADLMAAAGLTHGGFYKRFASKEALVSEAVAQAFDDRAQAADQDPAHFVDVYLSPAHRDDPGGGCPAAGFGADVAREAPDSDARRSYARGVEAYARLLDGDLAAVSTLVGAIVLARATAGTDLSDDILAAARADLTARAAVPPPAA
jgi:TetR/AcrR family transcriptional repressor of nem operon